MTNMTPYANAVHYQTQAADPARNVFVSANAGSGKTHVLVGRVSRILLSSTDVKPDHILCLTYTKAAASEMQTRLFQTLGDWSVMPEAALRTALARLYNTDDIDIDLRQARQLFAKALETPEGLKVQTIHAFCERLLSRFPVEAGILPGFEPLDDTDAAALYDSVWHDLIERAYAQPDSELTYALRQLMGTEANTTIDDLRTWMVGNFEAVEGWAARGGLDGLRARLGLRAEDTLDSIKARTWHAVDKDALRAAAEALAVCGKNKQETVGRACLAALQDFARDADAVAAFDIYAGAIFKKKDVVPTGHIGGKTMPDAVTQFFGDYNKIDTVEMQRLSEAGQALAAMATVARTAPVYTIATQFAAAYRTAKTARRVLDFSDQITLVDRLLNNSVVAEWVRYKLDMGIKHILVDEAQDTSPRQWGIIDALSDAFAHDPVDQHLPRTLFAVGDEKQSIYSFQGADPKIFIKKSAEVTQTDPDAKAIRFRMSFRSAPAVLRVVDSVFIDEEAITEMFDPEVVLPASDLIGHTANRDIAGLVEFWPLSPPPQITDDEIPWDPRPLDTDDSDSAREKLARQIARTVRGWIDTGEAVTVRTKDADGKSVEVTRPMRAGDILILVRKRSGPFFNAVIRNLKREGVAVAGADRLVLSESLAVQDLMALARFACLPEDDLALAEVLKGPVFDVSEGDLFTLAYGRAGGLWAALRAADMPWAVAATARLMDILALARKRAPYEFLADVLNTPVEGGNSTLRQFYARLSMEVEDPLQAFLARALAHQRRNAPSLQHFVQSFSTDTQTLKRELDSDTDQLRVMTVYGAKGLEAPVVILPDTSQAPTKKDALDKGMLDLGDGTFARPATPLPAALEPLRDARVAAHTQEYLRLLYVAMTRAESRLLVCGYASGQGKKGEPPKAADGSWHARIEAALSSLDGARDIPSPFDAALTGWAFGQGPTRITGEDTTPDAVATALPDWVSSARIPEHTARTVTPSHLLGGGSDAPLRSPLDLPVSRFRRGNLIHKLLELLPDLPVPERGPAAERFLRGHQDLTEAQRDDIKTVTLTVLNDPRFAVIFAPGSRAEVSLAGHADGLPDSLYLNAQIDRLAVTDDTVFIIDYKSNRPPPTDVADVSDNYLAQMAAYRALGRAVYPTHRIVCGLLWTHGPDMMILPDDLLDQAIVKISRAASLDGGGGAS